MNWFGPNWGAPCCTPEDHVSTPVSELCGHCDEEIVAGDDGFEVTNQIVLDLPDIPCAPTISYFHRACWLRGIVGSVAHQKCQCSCYGGTGEDAPGLSIREAALAALAHYERVTAPVFKTRLKHGWSFSPKSENGQS